MTWLCAWFGWSCGHASTLPAHSVPEITGEAGGLALVLVVGMLLMTRRKR